MQKSIIGEVVAKTYDAQQKKHYVHYRDADSPNQAELYVMPIIDLRTFQSLREGEQFPARIFSRDGRHWHDISEQGGLDLLLCRD